MPSTIEWEAARRGCLESCDRCLSLLGHISVAAYRGDGAGTNTIGPHVRHIVDHFTLFLRGIESGRIEYDSRERDPRLEHDPEVARRALEDIRRALDELRPDASDRMVEIWQTPSQASQPLAYATTGARELLFLSSHTIHHLALIACLCEQQGIDMPETFSLAFSTESHRQVTTS